MEEALHQLAGTVFCAMLVVVPIVSVVGTFATAIFINRGLARENDARAAKVRAAIAPALRREARDVRMTTLNTTLLAIGFVWRRSDVWLTPDALYLASWSVVWGRRMGKPVIAIALRDGAPKRIDGVSLYMRLREPPRADAQGRLRVVAGTEGILGLTMRIRLELPDAAAWVATM